METICFSYRCGKKLVKDTPQLQRYYVRYKCSGKCKITYSYCIVCMEFMRTEMIYVHEYTHDDFPQLQYELNSDNHISLNSSDKVAQNVMRINIWNLYHEHRELYMVKLQNHIVISHDYELDDITKHILQNYYSCRLCGMNYETYPTWTLVEKHMINCPLAKQIRSSISRPTKNLNSTSMTT